MNTLRIKPAKGWFVIRLDDEYNGQHLGGKVAYKVPVECWVYETGAEKAAMPFGYVRSAFEGGLGELVRDGESEPLAELAYDAILSPSGKVYWPFGEPLNSVDEWAERFCPKDCGVIMEVIEKPKGQPKSTAQSGTVAPF